MISSAPRGAMISSAPRGAMIARLLEPGRQNHLGPTNRDTMIASAPRGATVARSHKPGFKVDYRHVNAKYNPAIINPNDSGAMIMA
jgi:hypothetical protein